MDLNLDPDELHSCVQCGLCLPHCPTFRVTGNEALSPRGRIHLMREVHDNGAPLTNEVIESFETCVQCRGCEPACPSSVPFGHMMERTRESLADAGEITPLWQRAMFAPLTSPVALRAGTAAIAVASRLKILPKRLGLPDGLSVRQEPLQSTGNDAYLFTGCVMDAWQRDVHRSAQRVLTAAGVGSITTNDLAPCCGALHAHAGLADKTRELAKAMMANFDPTLPILVDSAGCGAAMKDYGSLLGTTEAKDFSARVFDIQEFLAERVDDLPSVEPLELRVAVQDPCHLRHVQRVHQATRTVLRPFVSELIELDDDGLCCGAGGAYSVLQPELSSDIRDRKVEAIERVEPDVVASANPCLLYTSPSPRDS